MPRMFTQLHADDEHGHCKACRWWQTEHEEPETAIGLCMQPELTHFSVQVSAHCGCNRFELEPAEVLAGSISGG